LCETRVFFAPRVHRRSHLTRVRRLPPLGLHRTRIPLGSRLASPVAGRRVPCSTHPIGTYTRNYFRHQPRAHTRTQSRESITNSCILLELGHKVANRSHTPASGTLFNSLGRDARHVVRVPPGCTEVHRQSLSVPPRCTQCRSRQLSSCRAVTQPAVCTMS